MEKKRNSATTWKIVSGVLAVLLITMSTLYFVGLANNNSASCDTQKVCDTATEAAITDTATDAADPEQAQDALNLWTEDAKLKAELTEYIKTITDKDSKDFIPTEDRIAVFDFDGTLFNETDPVYFDYRLLRYRVLDDPEYKDKASDFERETAQKIVTLIETGEAAKGLEVDHGKSVASAFKGMTIDEFEEYVKEFKNGEEEGYTGGMTRGEAFYKPMLQVVDYLQKNDFTVYIVSGTDRLIVRELVHGMMDLPDGQVIGSDETLVASGQNGANGLDYTFTTEDKLVTGGDFIIKNLQMNKVSVIMKEIGEQPVLSFGNSNGDSSMAMYTITNNPYLSKAFMLCCDDTEREYGNTEKADKMYKMCDENGWTPVSMKNDWTTIYGEDIKKK